MESINEEEISKLLDFLMHHKDFIKGLFLVPLSPIGRLEINQEKFFTYSDIIKNITNCVNVNCDAKYFLEFERLKLNVHKFLIKFGRNIPTGSQIITAPFKLRNKSLEEIIPTKELMRINLNLEKGNLFIFLRYFPDLISFFKVLLNSTDFYYENLKKGLTFISIYQITTDFNYIPFLDA